jgi:hypothetical protein
MKVVLTYEFEPDDGEEEIAFIAQAPKKLREAEATIWDAIQVCRSILKHESNGEETDRAVSRVVSTLREYTPLEEG